METNNNNRSNAIIFLLIILVALLAYRNNVTTSSTSELEDYSTIFPKKSISKDSEVIIVTGGAGYIGSHTIVELLLSNYEVIVIDNLHNSCIESIKRVEKLTGKTIVAFYKVDITDSKSMERVFENHKHLNIKGVIHFAGLKSVGESSAIPLDYYQNNIYGSIVLLQTMKKFNIKNIVFSSSATVYGSEIDASNIPKEGLHENLPTSLSSCNPYGKTKLLVEEMLKDLYRSDNDWNIVILRYFNPVGAHPSGVIGEDPNGIPNNLMPYVSQVSVGKRTHLNIFGNDYNTTDGTGIRDFIHVVDLAKGHVYSLKHIDNKPGLEILNLGTGKGYSVLNILQEYEKASGKPIPYKFTDRRKGDADVCFASAAKAERVLKWKSEYDISKMCIDSWNWQSKNPNGYK